MKKLRSIIRIAELDAVSDILLKLFEADKAMRSDAFLSGLFAEMRSLSDAMTGAIKRDKTLSSLEDADGERDSALRDLGTLFAGWAAAPIEPMKSAGQKLRSVFEKYGASAAAKSYDEESALIESLLDDLKKEEGAISAAPGATESVARLRAAEDDFKARLLDFLATKADEKDAKSATSLKKPLLSLVNDRLVPYLNTMLMADAARFANFAAKVEAELDRVNACVAGRAK